MSFRFEVDDKSNIKSKTIINSNSISNAISIKCPFCSNQIFPFNDSKTSTLGYIIFTIFLVISICCFGYAIYLYSNINDLENLKSPYKIFIDIGLDEIKKRASNSVILGIFLFIISLWGFLFRSNFKKCPKCDMKLE